MRTITFLLLLAGLTCHAQDPSVSSYFTGLCNKYIPAYAKNETELYESFCEAYDLAAADTGNIRKYHTLSLMHQVFTCTTCEDGSVGPVLPIPYFWHYRTPNPRHAILVDGRRNVSFTSIERKPYVFLRDMVAPTVRFSHPEFGRFSTFGWCSEREMAFACLLNLMGYPSHVISPSNHAVTEARAEFRKKNGTMTAVIFSLDNTFRDMSFSVPPFSNFKNIYDKRSSDPQEIARVRGITVPQAARERIDAACAAYVKRGGAADR